jgi:thymidylate kinase
MIPKIVLTGGACGGKSSAATYLRASLPNAGITPIFVPELATQLFSAGIRWKDVEPFPFNALRFQMLMVQMQMNNEEWYNHFAANTPGQKKVLICDRGVLDNIAYIPDESHDVLFAFIGKGYNELKARYQGIIHLSTLAFIDGYETNNPARYESPEEARQMCDRTFAMWSKGPEKYHTRIHCSVGFAEKMANVHDHVVSILDDYYA